MHKMNDACRKSKSKASRIHREAAAAVISLSYDLLAVKSFIFVVGSCFDSVIDVVETIKMIL